MLYTLPSSYPTSGSYNLWDGCFRGSQGQCKLVYIVPVRGLAFTGTGMSSNSIVTSATAVTQHTLYIYSC